MLMYRFESSRSPTYTNTKHHSSCQHGEREGSHAQRSPATTARLPVRPPGRVWSLGLSASSAPHLLSGHFSPDWKHKTTKDQGFLWIIIIIMINCALTCTSSYTVSNHFQICSGPGTIGGTYMTLGEWHCDLWSLPDLCSPFYWHNCDSGGSSIQTFNTVVELNPCRDLYLFKAEPWIYITQIFSKQFFGLFYERETRLKKKYLKVFVMMLNTP